MPTAKEEAQKVLDSLPNTASWDDIEYSIYVRERIERGRREADCGEVMDQEEIEARMDRWLAE
jgi:predicted transcriptional regulator